MTTYIALASSANMLPKLAYGGQLSYSTLTPEMFKQRLQYPHLIKSALNDSHEATIEAIKRRYDLDLPRSGGAPQIALAAGDELFIVQASFARRLKQGEVYTDDEVEAAPMSFLRWRVPVRVQPRELPSAITQYVFDRIIDDSYAIALWMRGKTVIEDYDTVRAKYKKECEELQKIAESANERSIDDHSREAQEEYLDLALECADVLRYALMARYVAPNREDLFYEATGIIESRAVLGLSDVVDVILTKYARRSAGYLKNIEAERRDAALLFPDAINIYK